MIILDCEQLDTEWFDAHIGTPSASNFSKILTPMGKPSASAKDYMYQLAGEILTGKKTETYQNATMQRGIEMEVKARSLYEQMFDVEVQQVGLIYPDEQKKYCCSPDGVRLDEEIGQEFKCPLIHTHISYLIANRLPTIYIPQVQGSMLITGFKRWDFMSYYPGLKPMIVKVERDDEYCDLLVYALDKFIAELIKTIRKLKEAADVTKS